MLGAGLLVARWRLLLDTRGTFARKCDDVTPSRARLHLLVNRAFDYSSCLYFFVLLSAINS